MSTAVMQIIIYCNNVHDIRVMNPYKILYIHMERVYFHHVRPHIVSRDWIGMDLIGGALLNYFQHLKKMGK